MISGLSLGQLFTTINTHGQGNSLVLNALIESGIGGGNILINSFGSPINSQSFVNRGYNVRPISMYDPVANVLGGNWKNTDIPDKTNPIKAHVYYDLKMIEGKQILNGNFNILNQTNYPKNQAGKNKW